MKRRFDGKISSNDSGGDLLVLFQRAGMMEAFFREMSKLGTTISKETNKTKGTMGTARNGIVGFL